MKRVTREVSVGGVKIGGRNNPIAVQSMTTCDTRDIETTVAEIVGLETVGCEIIRVAVPDMAAAEALGEIKRRINIPLVADIHFHHELALESVRQGVEMLRLNPGNIRDETKVREVVSAAKKAGIPIRVGVNFGSLPPVGKIGMARGGSRLTDGVNELAKAGDEGGYAVADHMVATALWEIGILETLDFEDIKISLKAFDVPTTLDAYRKLAPLVPYPFHLGITEAGTPFAGGIRSAVGLGILLSEGIGDTIRVSLAGDSREEVKTGFEILKSLNLRSHGPTLIACPSCGRADVEVLKLTSEVDEALKGVKTDLKVAVMGCEVNGPGEAKDADIGIAGGNGRAVIFRKGEKVNIVPESEMLEALMAEVNKG
ncbi:MAG TPA: flavodoxin-dependent (E)-4-hydroxy-3-methylbut-2-enyl-diphosphate synthase [Dehalococcoidia bacterium]|jgi:(E)-4-hydroxy-3-methylbut-2-enyl-diphosphate synthase|nr:4-hydroxy-3-methylbut-2-en-1-yl diphosphate synthase [Chloroflexota bacterium]MDP5878119.1 flavodoxin-dependent (E)-4-hydroxy-3-methylbut-2-enyl-diphosphate synthase [Dehalococcoidia bacterium]MDP6273330.1 flavodoxin-dependent (E)-4-hydroxy-3-methylbut-2-enyl-diphosphate synthase [Dehalococcoidia bacterium]MDP7160349.1 flavodoxin-dependent (E)-4-hydroxy-3-methylbut-2-enyl-diphosphate synthase [Dehalococcoidia bacterium]MDP7213901.1 flavodoxin-dependent (E)-4-hydroxy-3-methylbut-2-enyl-diphos|tara:strand:- start:1872 stop:2984 length:1113 start_codon:yes stop_codon:yes gene_type:complete